MPQFHSKSITDLSVSSKRRRAFSTKINASASRCSRNGGEADEFHKTRHGKQVVNANRASATLYEGLCFEQKFEKRNLSESISLCRAYWAYTLANAAKKSGPFRDFHISLAPSFLSFFFSSFILACSGSRRHSSPKLSLSLSLIFPRAVHEARRVEIIGARAACGTGSH